MKIAIRKPLCFTEIGRKDNQEDRLYPLAASDRQDFFILCDGMGGHERGEVAAEIVSTTLGRYFESEQASGGRLTEGYFNAGLAKAYAALDAKLGAESDRRPGTTLTALCLGSNGALAAHIGDSRIYQVRPGVGIIYRTTDHSLVAEMVARGEMTEEEAMVHPRRNVITRAMQPGLSRPFEATVDMISDIRKDDFFFLCCDGVLERLSDKDLVRILSDRDLSDQGKLDAIKAICDGRTRDNYTCWLVPVADVEMADGESVTPARVIVPLAAPEERPVVAEAVESVPSAARPVAAASPKPRKPALFLAVAVVALMVAAVLVMVSRCGSSGSTEDRSDVQDSVEAVQPTEAAGQEGGVQRPASRKPSARKEPRKDEARAESQQPEEMHPMDDPGYRPAKAESAAAAAAAVGGKKPEPQQDVPAPITESPAAPEPVPAGSPTDPMPVVE